MDHAWTGYGAQGNLGVRGGETVHEAVLLFADREEFPSAGEREGEGLQCVVPTTILVPGVLKLLLNEVAPVH